MSRRGLLLAAGLALGVAACSSGTERDPDGASDAGTVDAGSQPTAYPLPLLRMDSLLSGTTHDATWQGTVMEHGPNRDNPFGSVTPARWLEVRLSNDDRERLYYTLPEPFGFRAFPQEQVEVTYRERAATAGYSSYGALVTTLTGDLRILVEDGTWGPAFDDAQRLGFSFELDLGQPLEAEEVQCGKRVRYPVMVSNGERTRRLLPGQDEIFETDAGHARFVLLDAWRLEDALCGNAPELSIGYLALPAE